jgi:hypothetical protein
VSSYGVLCTRIVQRDVTVHLLLNIYSVCFAAKVVSVPLPLLSDGN